MSRTFPTCLSDSPERKRVISFDSVDGGMITLKMGGWAQKEVGEKSQFYGKSGKDTCSEMKALRDGSGKTVFGGGMGWKQKEV